MDPELRELLDRINDLTAEELSDLGSRLAAYFGQLYAEGPTDDVTPEDHAALLEEVATAVETVNAEATARETAAAEATAAEEARAAEVAARAEAARLRVEGGTPAADGTDEGDGGEDADANADAGDREPVLASGSRTVRPARRVPLGAMSTPPGATPDPAPAGDRVSISLVASADNGVFGTGTPLTSLEQVGQAIISRLSGLAGVRGGHGAGEKVLVASAQAAYPESRYLSADDPAGNLAKIEAVVTGPDFESRVAAGGLCGPLPVDFAIPEVGDLGREFRDSKTRFGADRGGIRTNVPPSLSSADDGVGIWTLTNDENPGDVSVPVAERLEFKPVVEFECGEAVESYVYAVTFRARFENIRARFNPETVASNTRLGLVAHARRAELTLMAMQADPAFSTAVSSPPQLLGASKDFFATLDAIIPRMRYRQRKARTAQVLITLPAWVADMLRADFVRQMPAHALGDQYAVADAVIANMAAARNVTLNWMSEDLDGAAAGGIGAAQGTGQVLDFPDTFRWFAEFPGEVLFLDGGSLDLGVIRDSALVAQNRYETFFETFEGLHFRGAEKPLVVTSTLNPNGSAAGLVATATGNATLDA